jgi:hypothetical protein
MIDWKEKLDAFLQLNEREILTPAGKISQDKKGAKSRWCVDSL